MTTPTTTRTTQTVHFSTTQKIEQMLEHLKAARRLAYDMGLHETVDMISKPIVAVDMALAAVRAPHWPLN